jgi:hypothetical protein
MAITDLNFNVGVRDNASRALFRVGDGFRNAGDRVGDFSRRLENAAGRSTRTSRALSRVSDGLTRIGVRAVNANIRLRQTGNNADDSSSALRRMGDAGQRAGAKITGALSALGGKVGASNPYVGGALAISAALLGIYAAAVATGAILTGLGAGFIALGVKGQKNSYAVKKAMTELGETTTAVLKRASGSLENDFVRALGSLRKTVAGTERDLISMFGKIANSGAIDSLAKGIDGFARNVMPGLSKAVDAAAPLLVELGKALPGLGTSFSKFFADLGAAGPGATKALISFLKVVGSQIELTGKILYSASTAWDKFTTTLDKAAAPFEPLVRHLGTVKSLTLGVTPAQQGLGTAVARTATAAEREATALTKVSAELVKQGRLTLDGREAERQFQQAVDDATAAVKENGRTLDTNTEKGRTNANALDAIAVATYAKHEAAKQAKWSADGLTRVLETGSAALVKQAIAFGMSEKDAIDYANSVLNIPGSKKTILEMAGMAKARGDIEAYKRWLSLIPRDVWTTLHADQVRGSANSAEHRIGRANGGIVGFASGGFAGRVRGAGTSTSDSIPAYLSNGEYVIKASSVKKAGVSTLDAINKTGSVPAMSVAGGGATNVTVTFAKTGDPLLDAIIEGLRYRVRSRHGGNVQRALGAGRA